MHNVQASCALYRTAHQQTPPRRGRIWLRAAGCRKLCGVWASGVQQERSPDPYGTVPVSYGPKTDLPAVVRQLKVSPSHQPSSVRLRHVPVIVASAFSVRS